MHESIDYENDSLTMKNMDNGYLHIFQISSWSKGVSILEIVGNNVKYRNRQMDYVFLDLFKIIDTEAGKHWIKTIPLLVRNKLLQFEKKTNSGITIPALKAISVDIYARELFINETTIFWILITTAIRGKWTYQKFIEACALKRKRILSVCGFEESKSMVKTICKMAFEIYDRHSYYVLLKSVERIDFDKINHIRYLNIKLVSLLIDFPLLYGSKLLFGLSKESDIHYLGTILRDAISLAVDIGKENYAASIKQCDSIAALIRLHDKWAYRLNCKKVIDIEKIQFSAPPLPEAFDIKPIQDSHELALEGIEQEHCVKIYQERIMCGAYYVYKVLSPQRATVGLEKTGVVWRIDQIQLKKNLPPSAETVKYVRNWFYKNSA